MNPALLSTNPRPSKPLVVFTCFFCFRFATLAATAADSATVTVNTDHGLHTVSYNTLHGTVRVYLPDDMAAGDTISGTVAIEPSGRTEAERNANASVLRGVVIDSGGQKTSASAPGIQWKVANAAKQSLPVIFTLASASRQRATASVPLASSNYVKNEVARIAETPGAFNWPPAIQQGSPATIAGPFDGNMGTTQLSVGGINARSLAESPRQAVFQTGTGGIPGPAAVEMREGDTAVSGATRSVQVQLSAPKTDLNKGEQTEVSIAFAGLQGLKHPLPVRLRTTGTVATAGGNLQQFEIEPRDPGIDANGTFRTQRAITGISPGTFEFAADIIWAHPAQNWFVGKTVHVEGEPGGAKDRWRVPVILPGGGEKYGIYFGGARPPNLHYCNWIQINAAEERDGIDYVTGYVRTENPNKPKTVPKTPTKPADTAAGAVPGASTAGGETTEPPKPPPCKEGAIRVLDSEEKKFTVLDGKQEMFLHIYADKDQVAIAAKEFADYLKKVAELGGKVGEHLPEGEGAGGATVDFLLKYLEHGSAILDAVLAGKLKLAGASEFTADMDVGLRDIVATCTTLEICRLGVWVREKKFTQAETKRRDRFTKKAKKGDDEWEKICDSTAHIDPAKASQWAQDFFTEQANILKGNYDALQKFKDQCK